MGCGGETEALPVLAMPGLEHVSVSLGIPNLPWSPLEAC